MHNKVLGSVMIVAGTAIGAGMLAIPLVTAELGFMMAAFLLIVCWAAMTLTGFLILHVNMAFHEHSNFSTMAGQTIGYAGRILTWIFFFLLLYALVAAYMTGGASLLNHFAPIIPPKLSALIFTVVLGLFVYLGVRSVDYANRILISLKAISLVLLVVFIFPHVHVSNLLLSAHVKLGWLAALPILLTSFGFQTVIPNLRDYLHSDVKKLKRVIWIGSSIPLVVYLLWEMAILGVVSGITHQMTLVEMISMLSKRLDNTFLGFLVDFFTDVAITTSFLGVSMGLFHFVRDVFHLNKQRVGEKGLAALVTFLPPLCFAWFYPEGFILALNYASVFVVILLIFIPVWMTWQLKRKGLRSAYHLDLHWIGSLALLGFGALLIAAHFLPG